MRITLCSLLVLSTSVAFAQTEAPDPAPTPSSGKPLTSEESAQVIAKFQQLQKDFEAHKGDVARNALGRFSSAALSEAAALQFYIDCQRVLDERKPDLDGVVTKEDAKQRAERLKRQAESIQETSGYAPVLQMQLQYLVLTMEAPAAKDHGALVARLRDFAGKAVSLVQAYAAPPAPERKGVASIKSTSKRETQKQKDERNDERTRHKVAQIAQQSVMGTPFANAYSLNTYFKPIEGWPSSPLDLGGIYEGMIFPLYREKKPDLLGSEWDQYIKLQAALERCNDDDNAYAKWLVGGYKELQWKKWTDVFLHGTSRVLAADELTKLCKENPNHPSVASWVSELAKLAESLQGDPAEPKQSAPQQ